MPEEENIKLNKFEKAFLQEATKDKIRELENLASKAQRLGVDTAQAVLKDVNRLKDLETKLL